MIKRLKSLLLASVCFLTGALAAQKLILERDVVRLHVVAASDSAEDQEVKLAVRDAVLTVLETMPREGLEESLPRLQAAAERTLEDAGVRMPVTVRLGREAFETRQAEGYALPAGIYQTLRLTIGPGQGHNWWGVVFPRLCCGESSQAWSGGERQLRFYLLEKLGQAENWLTEKMSDLSDAISAKIETERGGNDATIGAGDGLEGA